MAGKGRALASLLLAFGLFACDDTRKKELDSKATVPTETKRSSLDREPLQPLPPTPTIDSDLATLGRRLFEDKRLSADDTVSCATCHDLATAGVDRRPRSVGIRGQLGKVNAPSVYNSSLNFVQFWDGRAETLEDQVGGPVENPLEMGADWAKVIPKLRGDADYLAAFGRHFADGITSDNVKKAVASFERTLLTHDSPFDQWLSGHDDALSAEQKAGYELFKGVGCIACHQGRNVGGNMFQRFGVFGDYFKDRGNVTDADHGRFNVTHAEADQFVFRVPSLRNVEHTAPYFHDGSRKTLTEAVQIMARYQLGRALVDDQIASIVAFLSSLSVPDGAPQGTL